MEHANWTESTVQVNGLGLHVTRTGGNKPVLVLAHGFTDDGACWNALAEPLARDYDVVMYDARGHGLSELGTDPFTSEALADDLTGLIEALRLDKPGVIGHSMGAYTTALAAANRPDLFGFIVLEDPPWILDGFRPPLDWKGNTARLQAQTEAELIANGRRDIPRWSDAEWVPWARSKLRFNMGIFDQGGPFAVDDWRDIVSRIRVPTLLIIGDDTGALVTPETAREVQALNGGIEVVQIANAGHCIRRDQGSAFWQVLMAFLETQTKN